MPLLPGTDLMESCRRLNIECYGLAVTVGFEIKQAGESRLWRVKLSIGQSA